MTPLGPQLCRGTVFHQRLHPAAHAFTYPVSYVLFDPARPDELTERHPAWSTQRFRPVQLRADDYGPPDVNVAGLGDLSVVRLLTQPRRWGWLFNPISIFFAWHDTQSPAPAAAVVEVTNTPWKERHRYALALEPKPEHGDQPEVTRLGARFSKVLHVSPFLGEDLWYDFAVTWSDNAAQGRQLRVGIDAVDDAGQPVVRTALTVTVDDALPAALGHSLRHDGFPTHRTSFGIHRQALSLAAKRVPFVSHPKRQKKRQDRGQESRKGSANVGE